MGIVSTLFPVELEHLWGAAVCPPTLTPTTTNCRDKKYLASLSHPVTPSAKKILALISALVKYSFTSSFIVPGDACLIFLESVLSCLLLSKMIHDSSLPQIEGQACPVATPSGSFHPPFSLSAPASTTEPSSHPFQQQIHPFICQASVY